LGITYPLNPLFLRLLSLFAAIPIPVFSVIYYWHVPDSTILFPLAYSRNEQENLTPAQLKVLKSIIETEYP
jgi:hypothetical protein